MGNALVYVKGGIVNVVTDRSGYFNVEVKNLGEQLLTIRSAGYNHLDTLIDVSSESVRELKITLIADCPYDQKSAEEDILKGQPKLLISSGTAPVVSDGLQKFERKYKIRYVDIGEYLIAEECLKGYNEAIFKHLDSKFGKKWRKNVRSNVMFL